MPEYITDDTRERILRLPFDALTIEDQFAAQLLLLKEPGLCASVLHPDTMRKWLEHCHGRASR